jgi:hypothetical protein
VQSLEGEKGARRADNSDIEAMKISLGARMSNGV